MAAGGFIFRLSRLKRMSAVSHGVLGLGVGNIMFVETKV